MHNTIKRITKTLACLMLLLLSQGFTFQQPVKPTTPVRPTQEKQLTPKQEQISVLHKKLAKTAKISNARGNPTEPKSIENLPTLIANFKTRLQTFKTQTVAVTEERGGKTKHVDTYTFTNDTTANTKSLTATSAKFPQQKLAVSTEFMQLMQTFLTDSSLISRMLDIKALPVAVKDKEKNVQQRLQIKPKSEFKKLLGFSNGNVKFDAHGNLLSVALMTSKSGVQIYEFPANTKSVTGLRNSK